MSEIKDPEQSTLDPQLQSILDSQDADTGQFVYCATCSHILTRIDYKIEVNGGFAHTFTNPHNFTFHIGCFSQALGCDIAGEPQAADSWFYGYVWRLASCAECHNHLGWYFSRHNDFFYGLILDRIQEE
ncbi:MAG: cereblon family protein [Pseudomonadota bacterium]